MDGHKNKMEQLDEMEILTPNEILLKKEMEQLDGMEILTSNEILDNIKVYDSTVEVVGFVDGIEASKYVGEKQQYKVFKFYINNGQGRRVQVIAWNDDIEPVEPHVKLNHIIHLDGVQARIPKVARFNNGNVPYELQIQTNSTYCNLGKYNSEQLIDVEPQLVEFCDVMNTST
ncbi:unnamed protein product [Lasius platythorax]|uniref:Replication protein A OB domain-containing protein n=1 Tax=Lasius platythorax TaxID=488582 RepID=A0AAV2N509_9HYME